MALPSTKATTATTTHAVVQAIETYIQNQNLLGEISELDELLYDLIDLHKDNEVALKRVLQCIHNLLLGNNKYNVKFGAKVFHKLIAVVIGDSKNCSRHLVANALHCVQVYARKFPRIDGKFLIQQLWFLSLNSEGQPHAAQILVQLFDDFVNELGEECVCSSELHLLIKNLLQSETREYRKSAYFLMRKLADIMRRGDTKILDSLKCSEQQWSSYVHIMESLEEQQSHLVLPTLGTLLPRVVAGGHNQDQDDDWIAWLRILYVRLLQDNNILVLRWTLTFFLNHFDVTKLLRTNLLSEFLAATNRTQLYNVEGYCLPSFQEDKFMPSTEEKMAFLEALVTIPWHSVPLVFWLHNVTEERHNDFLIGKNLLLKLSSRIRALKNKKLRGIAVERVECQFHVTVDSLTLAEYLVYIETLYNISDVYNICEPLESKLQTKLLGESDTRIEDNENVLRSFMGRLQKHPKSEDAIIGILSYATKHLSDIETEKLILDMLENRNTVTLILCGVEKLSISYIVERILDGDITTGDARIEAAYAFSKDKSSNDDIKLRDKFIELTEEQSKERRNAIKDSLLLINKQLTERKPRYFENCKEHRRKIRIARALMGMQKYIDWSDELWNALLVTNDQLNISYMYECLVARLLPSFEMLIERMQLMETMKPSQQVSIISVAHLYCIRRWHSLKPKHLKQIVNLLWPHTMGAHFQTRLLAQLVIHTFAVKCEETSIEVPILEALKTSIEMTLGSRLPKFENETRLILSKVMLQTSSLRQGDAILYMTNAPFDEFNKFLLGMHTTVEFEDNLDEYRNVLITKKKPSIADHELPRIEMANLNVQRKVNPMNDIFNTSETMATDTKHMDQELVVVASLIDKLPNLGGLARTCEVLGVKTLILSAKTLVDKPDFTNLSMTAEKTLNIMEVKPEALAEFLIKKQSMGYKIVGAEQTAYSVSFADFKFPEKCVLLLGHEKHGIPVDLIALLDSAVEIPQFGVVRSLNVHVTGSLFIWEYCKQHLNK
ncbi:hypothetical protein ACLKA7_005334 [Drosophila subpalustris]